MNEYEASKVLDDYLTLPEVFQYYGYELKNGFCCCPFHYEKTASCKVNKFQFNCFGCGTSGNSVSFTKKLFNIDFKTAIQKLNADFNLGLLDATLTDEQKLKIKQKKLEKYKKTAENLLFEEKKQQYFDAWKHFVYFKPEEKNYNIDTPEYLINDYFDNIDQRFIEAINTITMLDDFASENNFKIEEFEARQMFIDGRSKVYTEEECAILTIGQLLNKLNEQWRRKSDNENIYKT